MALLNFGPIDYGTTTGAPETTKTVITYRVADVYPQTRYDAEANALYLRVKEGPVTDTREMRLPGGCTQEVIIDFDEHYRIVGIEVLNVKATPSQ